MTEPTRSVTVSRRIARDIETVFESWISPELIARWYAPVDDWVVGSAEIVEGVGGRYRITFGPAPDGDAYIEEGTYLEFDRPHRLVWDGIVVGGDEEVLRIEVTFVSDGDATIVTVVEQGLRSDESAAEHEEGWSTGLDRLASILEG